MTNPTSTICSLTKDNTKEDIGIIVGRFQTPHLHEGHKAFIDEVIQRHKRVFIFIGVSPNKRSRRNPLDYETRWMMLKFAYPNLEYGSLPDAASDIEWTTTLDNRITELFPFASVRLYGGRDSFIAHYLGPRPTTEIESNIYSSATLLRDRAGRDIRDSEQWRAGVIYGAYNQYPKTWQTIDVLPIRYNEDRTYDILLAQKPNETGKWRFIGGFVDPTDSSLEQAVRREVNEEAHIEIADIQYALSHKVDDWRYKDDVDKVMTTLFTATYVHGMPRPDDDISSLGWFSSDSKKQYTFHHIQIVSAHADMFRKVLPILETLNDKSINSKSAKSNG